jgi:GNAT superfamily N-acetyltransferase
VIGVGGLIEFVIRRVDHEDSARLLRAFYDEQVGRYGFAESIAVDPREFVSPNGSFVVAYRDGEPVGCGGWRWHDRAAGVAEIKKLHLTLALRGVGVGWALLTRLEDDALAARAVRIILETGARNTAALAMFARAGYRPIASYVPGRLAEVNRAFGRCLVAGGRAEDSS